MNSPSLPQYKVRKTLDTIAASQLAGVSSATLRAE